MKAIILAAGHGKRLRPLTNNLPKCMIKLFGKTILERQITVLNSCNINDISVITGHLENKINIKNLTRFHNPDYEKTNMVETLFCGREKLEGEIIISYGDIIYEKNILKKLISSKDDISIVVDKEWKKYWELRFENPLDDAESMILNNENQIQSIGQKVTKINDICGQYIGLMKFNSDGVKKLMNFYDLMKKESEKHGNNLLNSKLPFKQSYMTDLLQGLISQGHTLKAVLIKNGWLELDSINDYKIYNEMDENGILKEFYNE